jgi:PERQ amino acid-rich with GYF domain-containing protein
VSLDDLENPASLLDVAKWAHNNRPRRSNGAILSRRQSSTPYGQSESTIQTPSAEVQDPQTQPNTSYEASTDTRYSKEALLEIYKASRNSDSTENSVSRLFTDTWDPGHSNGTNGRGWGKTHDGRENQGPNVCWDTNGSVEPISLQDMTDAEKTVSPSQILLLIATNCC